MKQGDIPEKLYHAASKKFRELKPGFLHTKQLVEWDKTESNEFLYATDDRAEAINQGFAGAVEKKYKIDRYRSSNGSIEITFSSDETIPSKEALKELTVWLYTVSTTERQKWLKVNNQHNGLESEYKTKSIIALDEFSVEEIDVSSWLKNKDLKLVKAK